MASSPDEVPVGVARRSGGLSEGSRATGCSKLPTFAEATLDAGTAQRREALGLVQPYVSC